MAGRLKGQPKTGGRKAGTPNRVTAQRAAEIAASGLTPLDYMLAVLRDDAAEVARRDDMAKAAAPYCHPRLAAVDHELSGSVELGIKRIERVIVDSQDTDT